MAKKQLLRKLDIFSLVAYYFSTIVGVGAFIIPSQAAAIAGPASLLSWLLILLFAYPIAYIYAHISQKYQVSGSIQKFLADCGGKKFGKSMALYLVISAMFGNMLLAYASSEYLLRLFGSSNLELLPILSCAVLALACVFNLLQVSLSSRIQTISLCVLVVSILVIIISAIPSYNFANLTPFMPHGTNSVIGAMVICSYAITGWENVDAMAEEVKSPTKTYGKAIKVAIILISSFYLLLASTVILVLTPEQIAAPAPLITTLLETTVSEDAAYLGTALTLALLLLGCNSWVFGTSRLLYSLGKDHVLPEFFSYVSSTNRIPIIAVLGQLLFYATLALLMMISEVDRTAILIITAFNYLLLYAIVFLCGAWKFRTAKLKFMSIISFLLILFLTLADANHLLTVSIASLLICFFYIFIFKRKHIIL
jgi:amino acid efflux transporter